MPQSTLTCYSSGIGVFHRRIDLQPGRENTIRLPIRKCYRADLIASLRLFGKVRVLEPVSWPQDNEAALSIDSTEVEYSLLTALSGRNIAFTPNGGTRLTGVNLGLQIHSEHHGTQVLDRRYLLVQTRAGAIERFPLIEVRELEFEEEEVQAEIRRALANNAIRLKPQSTYVSLRVEPETGSENPSLWIQYAVPFPSWQPTYRLDHAEARYNLEGYAKIDYDAEDDLSDCQLTLVVGEPDTFETDLAECKIPARNRVNLVMERAAGGHVAADSFAYAELEATAAPMAMAAPKRYAMAAPVIPRVIAKAEAPVAVGRELGDYSVWTTPNTLTLRARQSCLIPLFDTPVAEAQRILYYNCEVNEARPKLALRICNPLAQSLGKGVCTVYEDGELAGTCILSAVKPGEKTLLLYATETGVKARREVSDVERRYVSARLTEGLFSHEATEQAETKVRLQSVLEERFTVLIEHARVLPHSTILVKLEGKIVETLADGVRIEAELPARGELVVSIVEKAQSSSQLHVDADNWESFIASWSSYLPTDGHPSMGKIAEAKRQLHQNATALLAAQREHKQAVETSKRLLSFLSNANAGSQKQLQDWQQELQQCHLQIKDRERLIATLESEKTRLSDVLDCCIEEATFSWGESPAKS